MTSPGPVVLSQSGYTEVTLYFDSIAPSDIGEMFIINLVHMNVDSGVNVQTTPSLVTLEFLGKNSLKFEYNMQQNSIIALKCIILLYHSPATMGACMKL